MEVIILILFILAAISSTHIVVGSSLFGPLRKYLMNYEGDNLLIKKIGELILCYQCCGFWMGVIYSFLFLSTLFEFNFVGIFSLSFLVAGPIVSLFSDLTYRLKQYICEECG